MSGPERRGAPRLIHQLPLVIADAGEEFVTKTQNLSVSGAYCTLKRFVEPMTKLRIRLELPGRSAPQQITCQGVVVRVDPPEADPRISRYHVAIFFNELADDDRTVLARYIQQRLQSAVSHG